ncbi:MAG: restriction endonuclease subunit S [Spirochaetales bacterium]|nr:restriction endonuclease subunit S [Spirochaetales bacterium]
MIEGKYKAYPEYKDSHVEWLGEVPEHWGITSLKHLVSIPIIDGPHESPIKHDKGIPFVSAEAISKGFINFDKMWGYISEEEQKLFSKRYLPKRNDILMVKLGATTGVVAIVETDEEFNIWVPLAAIRVNHKILAKYVYYVLKSHNIQDAIQMSWTYGTQQTLGLRTLENLSFPIPPKDVQKSIVNYIESIAPILEISIQKSEKSILLLQERRTALISAAVTGKIDVRDWKKPGDIV